MFRTFSLVLLAACTPLAADRIDPIDSEAPFDRRDVLGDTHQLVTDLDEVHRTATNDHQAFLIGTQEVDGEDLSRILVFGGDGIAPDQPSQELAIEDIPGASGYRALQSLSARDDLLAAGPYLYRRTAGQWNFETALGEDLDYSDRQVFLLGNDEAAVSTSSHVYVYRYEDGRWTNTQRVEAGRSAVLRASSADMFLVRTTGNNGDKFVPFGRNDSGEWVRVTHDWRSYWAINGNHAMSSSGTVYHWDGEEFLSTDVQFETRGMEMGANRRSGEGFAGFIVDERITVLTDDRTSVYDLDGTLIAENDEAPVDVHHRMGFGAASSVSPSGSRALWTVFHAPEVVPVDPDRSFSQVYTFSLEAGEETELEFQAPVDLHSISVQLTGGGDADLYVDRGQQPTDSNYLCRPFQASSEETCLFEFPEAGTWHVRVVGFEGLSEVELTIDVADRY